MDAVIGIIIVGREIAVSALREWMLKLGSKGAYGLICWEIKDILTNGCFAMPTLQFQPSYTGN